MSRMHTVEFVFAVGWAAFWIYWLVAAFSMKRGHIRWSRELPIRALVAVGAVVVIRVGAFRDGEPQLGSLAHWLRRCALRARAGVCDLGTDRDRS